MVAAIRQTTMTSMAAALDHQLRPRIMEAVTRPLIVTNTAISSEQAQDGDNDYTNGWSQLR